MLIPLLLVAVAAAPPATMRLDYVHSGDAREEHYALDAVVREGAWPGPPDRRLDDSNLGRYLFEVRDDKSGAAVYSRGFASVFGEWESTPEAKDRPRAFHESVRFPEPAAPVTVTIKKRDARGALAPVWSVRVDPSDPAIDRRAPPGIKVWSVVKNGEPADKVDLLLLGDGYPAAEMDKWHRDAKRLAFTPYVFVHEFGHHFAGLADEYYTSAVAYEAAPTAVRPEPWEPNATADPQAAKWRDLVSAGVPRPTPWPKDEFEAAQRDIQARRRKIREQKRPEAEMEALFLEERTLMTKLLGSVPYAGRVGAFEGAIYEAKGYYRPQVDCIMFTRDEVGFCAVCRRAIERVIALYAR